MCHGVVPSVRLRRRWRNRRSGLAVPGGWTSPAADATVRDDEVSYRRSIGIERPAHIDCLYEHHDRPTDGPAAGHARSPDPQVARARAAARARRRAPRRADHARDLPGETGVALPGALPDGGGGLAERVLGRLGE